MRGKVVSVSAHSVLLKVDSRFNCARCAAGKGCGAGVAATSPGARPLEARLSPGLQVAAGQDVRIELAPRNLLMAAIVVYGAPLAGAVAGALLAWTSSAGDLVAAGFTAAGLAAGILASRFWLGRENCLRQFTPTVVAQLTADDPA